ncbi:single-stranded DNA-binding protein [Pseudactinotalea sp. HY160]|uniref:single-stranded DNA-binding protein n=1 Tax=Pseudactinotalea sp. HY160 TaxID=2654490 RepID=UPI00128C10FC|nr:single-stranded DNA-binding protein [Pseudactinotalea sp. HY160]MPV51414.1 single-stranded DNA-binding protein [Pseudactinotalea sp. HY160]
MSEDIRTSEALHGHVGTDPKVTRTASGSTRVTFRLGVAQRVQNIEGEWVDGTPTYVTVAMYGKSAERTAARIRKGDNLIVAGRLHSFEVTDETNGPRVLKEFRASRVGFDLNITNITPDRPTTAPSANANTGPVPQVANGPATPPAGAAAAAPGMAM